jgi:arginine exporter protein ArgO
MINAGIVEYAAILAAIGGGATNTSFEPTWNVIVIVGGIIFLFWLVVFKL